MPVYYQGKMLELILTDISGGGLSLHADRGAILAVEASVQADSAAILACVLLSLVVIYCASKAGGELANRFGFPPVLGELVGGLVVGVSGLGWLAFPDSIDPTATFPIAQLVQQTGGISPEQARQAYIVGSEVIALLSELGVIVLLFEIGLESDLRELLKVGPQALTVAVVGVIVPFAAGTAGLMLIFQLPTLPAVFAGAALTATSIGITSKVMSELGQLNSVEGKIVLGAAVADDVLGIVVLAVVASLVKTGEIDVTNILILIASATAFLVGAVLCGRVFNKTFVAVTSLFKTRGGVVIPAFIFAFLMAFIGAAIHLEAILGSFAAGLVLDETDKRKELDAQIKPIADVLVPIFFVTVGARTDLSVLNPVNPATREGMTIALFLVVVAILGKVVTGLAVFGQDKVNRLAIGLGMIPRGEVGLVFAGVGSASGVLSPALNTATILMVIATTFLAPPLLQYAFPRKAVEAAETPG